MPLEFDTMTPGGRWSDVCDLGILDLRRNCHDEVVAAFPRFLGRWEDGNSVDLILSTGSTFETSDDACVPSTLSGGTTLCNYVIPNQRLMSYGGGQNKQLRDLVAQFCKGRNLHTAPTLFNPDGSFDMGNPLTGYFIDYMLSEMKGAFMNTLITIFWNGDATVLHQHDGVLTQLDADVACEPYNPVEIDWATLTGVVGVSSPKSEIDNAHDTITIQGQAFSGMEGTDFAEFLKMWVERLFEGPFATYAKSEVMLELWVPRNSSTTILELAACLQPCDGCVNPLSDPNIRDRAQQFIREKRFFLYPYTDVMITVRTSPMLVDRMILIPMYVGGKPMAGWVFRSQPEQQAILDGLLPLYGTGVGSIPATDLFPDELNDLSVADNFEAQAVAINFEKTTDCVSWWLTADAAIVIFGRDNILSVTNIAGTGLVQMCDPGGGVFVDVTPESLTCTDGPLTNELTISDLDTINIVASEVFVTGDTYLITFGDGTVVRAVLTVSDDTTIVLTFPTEVTVTDCTTFGGPASIATYN